MRVLAVLALVVLLLLSGCSMPGVVGIAQPVAPDLILNPWEVTE